MATATLLDIARALGLSKVSVSAALLDKPGVSEATRAKVKAEAERIGYQPNPTAAELMAMVRGRRNAKWAETLAFVNTFRHPDVFDSIRGLVDLREGAAEQARHYGYRLENFEAYGKARTPDRLRRILRARGVRGVLIGPRWIDEPEVDPEWAEFNCVLVGETRSALNVDRVCNHHAQSAALALTKMAERGYKRIGLVLLRHYEEVRGFDYLGGLAEARSVTRGRARFFTFLNPGFDWSGLIPWVRGHRLDAVVSLTPFHMDPKYGDLIREDGLGIGYAHLNLEPGFRASGIDQHSRDIGATAVDLLRASLHAGARGSAHRTRIVLMEGSWVEGHTAPRIG